jgi:hypothetical protein
MRIAVKTEPSPDTPEGIAKIVQDLNWLDFDLRIGEEPYEIDCIVSSLGKRCGHAFALWAVARGSSMPIGFFESGIDCFFHYTYLERWQRGRSIAKVNKPFLRDFITSFGPEVARDVTSPPNIYEMMALFYHFLSSSGYAVNEPRISRAIAALRQEQIKLGQKQNVEEFCGPWQQ